MFSLRTMRPGDFDEVAELIFLSTNHWYEKNLGRPVFTGEPGVCRVFCDVYGELDPGYALVAVNESSDRIIGSCFYHPRETHLSLGIMNVHPNYFGAGVASRILNEILAIAAENDLPVRLVSSALNLDSFSLYNRLGFAPLAVYQDMILEVPRGGWSRSERPDLSSVRAATTRDVDGMGALEFAVSGISREKDYRHFLDNRLGIWETRVSENASGELDGFLVSVDHPGCTMIGPGVARDEDVAERLLLAQLDRFSGRSVVFLLPAHLPGLAARFYARGAKNCELHLAQANGEAQPVDGIVMPTFLPESA